MNIPQQNSDNFDDAILDAMKIAKVPGAAILVICDGHINYTKGYGLADPETGRVVTPDTLFTIASIFNPETGNGVIFFSNGDDFDLSCSFLEENIKNLIGSN